MIDTNERRRRDDAKTPIEWLLKAIDKFALLVGLFTVCLVGGLAVGYAAGRHEAEASRAALKSMAATCGSCRKGENK